MLAALASEGERPRLVHRLDRDTSGILVVAKTAAAAAKLTRAFRQHKVDKLYWALVVGRPALAAGIIDQPLAKQGGAGRERVAPDEEGRFARTAYQTVARAGRIASWLAMKPLDRPHPSAARALRRARHADPGRSQIRRAAPRGRARRADAARPRDPPAASRRRRAGA